MLRERPRSTPLSFMVSHDVYRCCVRKRTRSVPPVAFATIVERTTSALHVCTVQYYNCVHTCTNIHTCVQFSHILCGRDVPLLICPICSHLFAAASPRRQ